MQCLGISFEVLIKVINDTFLKYIHALHYIQDTPCTHLTISKESAKAECLGKLFQVLIKFLGMLFPKYFLNCSTNGAMSSSFLCAIRT